MSQEAAKLRSEIANLKGEIACTERKHQGTALALSRRKTQLSRLMGQLAMCESAPALAQHGCRL